MLHWFQPYSIDSVSRNGVDTTAIINQDLARFIVEYDVGGQEGYPAPIICGYWLGNDTPYNSQVW